MLALLVGLAAAAIPGQAPAWKPCGPAAYEGRRAECAVVTVPLDHARPAGARIGIAVKRLASAGSERRQLWFVDGGPGDAGTFALDRIVRRLGIPPGTTIYTFDHRGVGGSAPLECPAERAPKSPDGAELTLAEWPRCVGRLRATRKDLAFISVGQAARDLDLLIGRTRAPGVPSIVWGASYGTFLVWEYLRVATTPPDAVIQDGIVPPDWSFAEFDRNIDLAGRRWLELCRDDEACRAGLGPDPLTVSLAAAEHAGTGPCGEIGLSPYMYRLIQGNLLMSAEPYRRLIPAVARRAARCSATDAAELKTMFERLFQSGKIGESSTSHNPIAQRHIAYSALWPDPPPDPARFERALDSVVMTTGVSAAFAKSRTGWPVGPPASSREPPAFGGPMLLLHGGLDPTVSMAREAAVRGAYRAAGQTFVPVEWAGHVTLREGGCIRAIYLAFLERPGPVDTACVSSMRRPVVVPDSALAMEVFGVKEVWGRP
jgi:pimeloyl-ACP methyl ester carboxylesterase